MAVRQADVYLCTQGHLEARIVGGRWNSQAARNDMWGSVIGFARRYPFLCIWLLAFATRAGYVLLAAPNPFGFGDANEYEEIAHNLLAGKGWVQVEGFIRPPLYPLFLAGCYALDGVACIQLVQIVVGSASAILVGLLAQVLHAHRDAAWASALLAALYPWFFKLTGTIATETLFTFMAIASLWTILLAAEHKKLYLATFAAVLFGVACLVRPNLLPLAPLLVAWLWWRVHTPLIPIFFTAGLLLTLLPFTVYNWVQGNGIIIVSSGGGMNFYTANNPTSTLLYSGRLSDDEWKRLSGVPQLAPQALAFLGCSPAGSLQDVCADRIPLREREKFFYKSGFRYIRSAPKEWALTAVRKVVHYWRPWVDPRIYPHPIVILSGVSFSVVLILAGIAVFRMSLAPAVFVVLIALGTTVTSVLWGVQLRYRYALLDPLLLAVAGRTVVDLLARMRRSGYVFGGSMSKAQKVWKS